MNVNTIYYKMFHVKHYLVQNILRRHLLLLLLSINHPSFITKGVFESNANIIRGSDSGDSFLYPFANKISLFLGVKKAPYL